MEAIGGMYQAKLGFGGDQGVGLDLAHPWEGLRSVGEARHVRNASSKHIQIQHRPSIARARACKMEWPDGTWEHTEKGGVCAPLGGAMGTPNTEHKRAGERPDTRTRAAWQNRCVHSILHAWARLAG